jgi:hypothetical protein
MNKLHSFDLALEALEDSKRYPISHPRMEEIPNPTQLIDPTFMQWAHNWDALRNERRTSPTWSNRRRGNMFV